MSPNNDAPIWWPSPTSSEPTLLEPPSGVVVVSANYNTKALISLLLWSLHRFLGDELCSVVVVDNGSSDGSTELLQAAADADICKLITNPSNRHHGPALSQTISSLAKSQLAQNGARPWIWLLDSDCAIVRTDVATSAMAAAMKAKAALVGESYWNRWNARYQFSGFSLLLDPARIWRPHIGAIPDGGDPIGAFEQSCRENGISCVSFPFTKDGYLIHRGRSTLAAVRERAETSNPHYEWAQSHYEPHFQEVPTAQARYVELVNEFNQQVPDLQPDALIHACQMGANSRKERR